jgi:hypothetical protein
MSELDQRNLNNNSYAILNKLKKAAESNKKSDDTEKLFGRYRKLPGKSTLI